MNLHRELACDFPKEGQCVSTPFGAGHMLAYRKDDGIFEIKLDFGTLFCSVQAGPAKPTDMNNHDQDAKESQNVDDSQVKAVDLNLMYESLEKMRRLNLELACQEKGIEFDHGAMLDQCMQCILERPPSAARNKDQLVKGKEEDEEDAETEDDSDQFPFLRQILDAPMRQVHMAQQVIRTPPKSCLICGAPTCSRHASASFAKENITLCLPCEHLFSLEYVVECLTAPTPEDRLYLMDRMLDIYDRALLLLRYSSQYIDRAAQGLEESMKQTNRVNVGSSGVGVMSGMLGVCAAATILTPVGPPLLVASLVFGGSASVLQTSTDLRNYYSEPNQLADRVIALDGMIRSILQIVEALHDVTMRDLVHSGMYHSSDASNDENNAVVSSLPVQHDRQTKSDVVLGMTACRVAATTVELSQTETALAEKTAVHAGLLNKSGMMLLRTVRAARFAGGALSAATVVLEVKSLNDTLNQIQAGNPCDKADLLRTIKKEMDCLPSKNGLAAEVEKYLSLMARRRRNMTEREALEALRRFELSPECDAVSLSVDEDESEQKEQNTLIKDNLFQDLTSDVQEEAPLLDELNSGAESEDKDGKFFSALQSFQKPWDKGFTSIGRLAASFQDGLVSLGKQADLLFDADISTGEEEVGSSDAGEGSFDEDLTA